MASVGSFLRDLRARRGVSLEEVARKTRVTPRYLEALEADAYDQLPAPVFVRGFIRAYCQALGESPEEALACYDGVEGRTPPATRPAASPTKAGTETRTRGTIVVSFVLLVVLGMALFTVALVIRPRDRAPMPEPRSDLLPATQSDTTPSTPPAASPLAVSSPTVPPPQAARPASPPPGSPVAARAPAAPATTPPTPPVAARAPTPVAPPAAQPGGTAPAPAVDGQATSGPRPAATVPNLQSLAGSVSSPYRLVARTYEATWIRVRTEDGRTSEDTLPAGETRAWVSDRPFEVSIGNAGGVALELNGRTLPPLGGKGVVIQRLVLPPAPR
jgi:cytoskeleton protein RodZ